MFVFKYLCLWGRVNRIDFILRFNFMINGKFGGEKVNIYNINKLVWFFLFIYSMILIIIEIFY